MSPMTEVTDLLIISDMMLPQKSHLLTFSGEHRPELDLRRPSPRNSPSQRDSSSKIVPWVFLAWPRPMDPSPAARTILFSLALIRKIL